MPTIRTATRADLPTVVDFWNRAAGPTSRAGQVPEAEGLLARDPDALIVAEEDGRIIGTLIVGWDGWRCHLYRLAVDPDARRNGVARALLTEAHTRAVVLGAFRFDAMVHRENPGAEAFWTSAGFELEPTNARWTLLLD